MASDDISISFNCKPCGTKVEWPDDSIDSTLICCSNCGEHFGTYGDLQETAMDAAKARVRDLIRETFKG